jgi:lysophospholipase L1-like esterase
MCHALLATLLVFVAFARFPVAVPPLPIRVLLVGDSTLCHPTGYGDALCARFSRDVTCLNLAKGGRSSKSYRAEGSWDEVLEILADRRLYSTSYVLIEFGHNDQPGKGERSTTLPEFEANLAGYLADVRDAGAIPILVTPLTRRLFMDGELTRGLEPWAVAARHAATQGHAPLLDLYRDSIKRVEKMGPEQAVALAEIPPTAEVIAAARTGTTIEVAKPPPREPGAPPRPHVPAFDYTHLGPNGAEIFSAIVRREIREAVPALRNALP